MLVLASRMASPVTAAREIGRRAQRPDGPASVLAIGTANPPNCIQQDAYADYYLGVAKRSHLTNLKEKDEKNL
jgi:hypothetical protein